MADRPPVPLGVLPARPARSCRHLVRAADAHRDLVAGEVRQPERKQSRALESQQAGCSARDASAARVRTPRVSCSSVSCWSCLAYPFLDDSTRSAAR